VEDASCWDVEADVVEANVVVVVVVAATLKISFFAD
jgi:hypothetical protein